MRVLSWILIGLSFPVGLALAWWVSGGCDVEHALPLAAAAQLVVAVPAALFGGVLSGRSVAGTLARTAAVVVASLAIVTLAMPAVPAAIERARVRRTVDRLHRIGEAVAVWREAHEGGYPVASDAVDLIGAIGAAFPSTDGWGNPWRVRCDGSHCAVVSLGACGEPDVADLDQYVEEIVDDVHADLVSLDGRLIRGPRLGR